MLIYQDLKYRVKRIEFCCGEMSNAILLRTIITTSWTDHSPRFFINTGDNRIVLNNCPFCGCKIKSELE